MEARSWQELMSMETEDMPIDVIEKKAINASFARFSHGELTELIVKTSEVLMALSVDATPCWAANKAIEELRAYFYSLPVAMDIAQTTYWRKEFKRRQGGRHADLHSDAGAGTEDHRGAGK